MQVVIDANTRLSIAVSNNGQPQRLCAWRDSGVDEHWAGTHVISHGGYRGNTEIVMPNRKRRKDRELPAWQQALDTGEVAKIRRWSGSAGWAGPTGKKPRV